VPTLAAIPQPLTRVEYERMVERGVFDDERVELICGELVPMSPQGPRHMAVIRRLTRLLVHAAAQRADVHAQGPLAVSDDSEPEPDIALIAPVPDDVHPSTAYLVVEVAYTSLARDRGIKAALYAGCGVPEYWIIDVDEQVIEVRSKPRAGAYRNVATRRRGDVIELIAFPDIRLAVDDIV
jgi:Uma2 family endonuclease